MPPPQSPPTPGYIWQWLETFLIATTVGGSGTGTWGVEARDANILQPHRRAHTTKGYPAPNVHSAKAEYRANLQYSPMYRLTVLKHPFPKLMAPTG